MTSIYEMPMATKIEFEEIPLILCISAGPDRTIEIMELED